MDKLITLHENILESVNRDADIFVANDDTETEIQTFESDCIYISKFGVFISKRKMIITEIERELHLCYNQLQYI